MMLKHTLSFVIFMVYLNLNAQWKKIYTNNQNDLYDVQLIGNTGYICGINSTMLKTTDTGKSWKSISLPTFLNARTLFFKDSAEGFVTGENARILKTINGGNTWVQKYIQTAAYAYDIKFAGNNGICVGNNLMALRSNDFGETWQSDTTYSSKKQLNSICILPNGQCWAVGDSGYILHKKISNKRWIKVPHITKISLNHITHIGDSILFISGGYQDTVGGLSNYKNIFIYSNDSGNTWQQTTFSEMKIINKAWFVNKDTAYFIGNSGIVIKSYNPTTNRSLQLTGTANSLNSISFINNMGIIVGDGGLILRTTNNGGFRLKNNLIANNHLSLYPNPSNGKISINVPSINYKIKVYAIDGKEVEFNRINSNTIEIETSGIYYVSITDENYKTQIHKIVILK